MVKRSLAPLLKVLCYPVVNLATTYIHTWFLCMVPMIWAGNLVQYKDLQCMHDTYHCIVMQDPVTQHDTGHVCYCDISISLFYHSWFNVT